MSSLGKKNRKTFPITIAWRKIKYLGMNPSKEMEEFFKEIYSTLTKDIESNKRKWKVITFSWVHRANTVKMFILSKQIY